MLEFLVDFLGLEEELVSSDFVVFFGGLFAIALTVILFKVLFFWFSQFFGGNSW